MRDIKQLSAALLSSQRFDPRGARDSQVGSRSNKSSRQAANWPLRIACSLLALIAVAYGIRALLLASANSSRQGSISHTVQSAFTNPVGFAKSHVTGGIGALLLADPASGLPRIQMVIIGSPAEKAGLRSGDLILGIDGAPTHGRTLIQNIESIRGFAIGTVRLTIQRAGSTNLICVIQRTSWSGMGIEQ